MFVIAGASGKTGKVVIETLASRGRKVRAIVRDAAKGEGLRARGAEVAVASLDDPTALGRALEGAEGLYALLPEDPAVEDFHGHRRRMADSIASAVRAARVPHVVFLSAPLAALPDGNGPAKDLHYAERALRATGATVTVIRASYFQDNVVASACPARTEGTFPSFLPSPNVAFPTIATRDLGAVAARCLIEPPDKSEVVDLVGPAYSVRDMADALGRAIGRPLDVVTIPPAAHVEVLTQRAGLPSEYAEALAEMFACFASGVASLSGDRVERGATELEAVLREGLG